MLIGFHVSIAGGFHLAVERALALGCTTMQIFSHSPRMWKVTKIDEDAARKFCRERKKSGISPLFVHTSYLINLASADGPLYEKSINALRDEMQRAGALGAEYVVTHLGSASSSSPAEAARRVSAALAAALDGLGPGPGLLLENTAGERGDVGHRFEDIARIIEDSGRGVDGGLGVTFDTCHGLGAGYDIKSARGLERTLGEMDGTFGLKRLRLVHLNDSMHPIGSGRDRHENLGEGRLGRAAIGRIINHPRLRDLPFVMETPVRAPGDDTRNIGLARKLRKG